VEGVIDSMGGSTVMDQPTFTRMQSVLMEVSQDPYQSMLDLMDLYSPPQNQDYPKIRDTYIDINTAAGKIFMGLYQNIWAGDEDHTMRLIAKVSQATSMDPVRLFNIARNHDAERFFTGMKLLFSNAGYSHIFSADIFNSSNQMAVSVEGSLFTNSIHIAFSPSSIKTPHHARVSIVDADNPQQQILDPVWTPEAKGQLFYDLKLSQLDRSFIEPVRLKVVVWYADGTTTFAYTKPVRLEWDGTMEGLSTLPKNAENRDEEDIVLDLMQKSHHLYYDDLETWTWSMASTAHDGTSVNAIDFIRSGADNAPIVTPYKGKVVYNQRDSQGNPTLILEHKITTGGRTVYWYTKYLHMHVNADGKVYSLDGSTNQIVSITLPKTSIIF
jgi:hypothetical protein